MKNRTVSFAQYAKWLIAVAYLLVALWSWLNRHTFYNYIPALTVFGGFPLDCLFAVLILSMLVCFIELLKWPGPIKRRWEKAAKRSGLKNSLGEIPSLVSVKGGKKPHSIILEVRSVGLSEEDFMAKSKKLKAELGLKLIKADDTSKKSYVLLHMMPTKFDKPTEIIPEDKHIGSHMDVSVLINLLVVGATGAGKTVATRVLMKKIACFQKNTKFWILDFKAIDFKAFDGEFPVRYYAYNDCVQGLEDFYNEFKNAQGRGQASQCPQYLVFDEWGAFILSQDKRQADRLKQMLAELIMMGRAYKFYVICGLQRADASHFLAGARDQFMAILCMGNLSNTQKQMLIPEEYREQMDIVERQGEGYLYVDGKGLEYVRIAVKDPDSLDDEIKRALYQ